MKTLTAEAPIFMTRVPKVQFTTIETYPSWLEIPLMTGTDLHGPEPVQATEVLLH